MLFYPPERDLEELGEPLVTLDLPSGFERFTLVFINQGFPERLKIKAVPDSPEVLPPGSLLVIVESQTC
jgi:hypothetical protein